MEITHIGYVICHTPSRNLFLNDVLYAPSTAKNLVSVHRLAQDNNVFLEFHPDFFLIKDRITRKILLEGPCKGGLYPLPADAFKFVKNKHVLVTTGATKPSVER